MYWMKKKWQTKFLVGHAKEEEEEIEEEEWSHKNG